MTVERRSTTIWPHLIVLFCLFVISVKAPRSWRDRVGRAPLQPEITTSLDAGSSGSSRIPLTLTARPETAIAPDASLLATADPPTPVSGDVVISDEPPAASDPNVAASDPPLIPPSALPPHLPPAPTAAANRSTSAAAARAAGEPHLAGDWCIPQALLLQLDVLRQDAEAGEEVLAWVARTSQAIHRLASLGGQRSAAEANRLVAELGHAADEAQRLAGRSNHPGLRFHLRHTGYALRRRVDLWASVSRWHDERWARRHSTLIDVRLRKARDAHADLPEMAVSLPRSASPAAASTSPPSPASASSGSFTSGPPAVGRIDARQLLVRLEAYEELGTPSSARSLAESYLAACVSQDPTERELAGHLDRLYRNGNLRVAISGELINRCLPQPQDRQAPVRDRIVGADVRGCSDTATQLFIRLIPDPHRIRLGLEAHGTVRSNTFSASGPVTFHSLGTITYLARKLVLMGPEGRCVFPSVAQADVRSSLCNVETTWDGVPLIGSLVRGVAISEREDRLPEADCAVETKVINTARQQLDEEAGAAIAQLERQFEERLSAVLDRLSLEATSLEVSTSQQRIVWRGRLSGADQLGSHTPRPQAPNDSQVSVQLHQSALHNIVDRLQLDGKRLSFVELVEQVAAGLGLEQPSFLEEIPADAYIRFADKDAVRIRFEAGQVEIVLAVAELARADRTFEDFAVTAVYRPAAAGMQAQLVRDGIIHLHGRPFGTGTQIALRGIFAKLFPKARPIDLLRAQLQSDPRFRGLQVTQFVAESGWLGLSVGPRRAPGQPEIALGRTEGVCR